MNDPRASGSSAVLEAEQARTGAMIAGDADTLDRLLDDECVYVHSSGAIDTKTAYLDRLRDGTLIYRSVRTSGHRVYTLGQGCAVSHRMDAEVILHGVPRPYQGQVMSIWRSGSVRIAADLPAGDNDPRRFPDDRRTVAHPGADLRRRAGGAFRGGGTRVARHRLRAGRAATRADPNPATSEDAQRQDAWSTCGAGAWQTGCASGRRCPPGGRRTWRSAPACWVMRSRGSTACSDSPTTTSPPNSASRSRNTCTRGCSAR